MWAEPIFTSAALSLLKVTMIMTIRFFDTTSSIAMSSCMYIQLASIPGCTSLREVGLVSTACACANIPPVSGGLWITSYICSVK